jgi:hypothetical protein
LIPSSRPRIYMVLGLCFLLFLLNAAWLAYFQHTYATTFHSSPFYPIYLDLRSLALKPYTLFILVIFVAWGLFGVFRPTNQPLDTRTELQRLTLLAMVVCSVLGLALLLVFKL